MLAHHFSRRHLLASLAVAAGGAALGGVRASGAAAPPTKETGLSSEGLLVGRAGFQPRTLMPLPHEELPGFLSRAQLAAHHAEYVRAVEELKGADKALASLDRDAADPAQYASLRRRQVAAGNAVLLHEFYFGAMAPQKVAPPGHIERNMAEHMGSWESWRADFTACAMAAKAWSVLVYDPYDDRWHNAVMDRDDEGAWVGANPLVVCDVAEHAFAKDYARREDYVARFLDHIDWQEVSRRYKSVDRM